MSIAPTDDGLEGFDFPGFFERLARLTLRSRKRVTGKEAGSRLSTKKGRGLEPVGYREYEPGDPMRLIDWIAYAKTEKFFVKEYEEERALETHVLLDTSESMGFEGKLGFGGKLAAGVAFLAEEENEAFGLSTFSDALDPGRVERGRMHLMDTVARLEQLSTSGRTDLLSVARKYADRLKHRALLVVVSDFLEDPGSVKDAIHVLGDHDLILIQVASPAEIDPPFEGETKLVDAETGEERDVYFSEKARKRYSRVARRHATEIGEAVSEVEGHHVPFYTNRNPLDAMFDLVSRRV